MKLTFEAERIETIFQQMETLLARTARQVTKDETRSATQQGSQAEPQGPGPEGPKPVDKPEDIFVDTPVEKAVKPVEKKPRTPKQLENDERLRQAALAKIEAKKEAKAKTALVTPGEQYEKEIAPRHMPAPPPPATAESLGLAPDEVVNIRQRTIAELQEAYANGHQAEVFELLSRFGNGAKSFRELPPESFVPIREAIDNGALT